MGSRKNVTGAQEGFDLRGTVVGARRNNRRINKSKIVSPGEWQRASDDLLKA
jgi:hypothetical protein